jgi:hypothetical protein
MDPITTQLISTVHNTVLEDNTTYRKALSTLITNGISTINIQELTQQLIKEIKDNPSKRHITVTWKLSMDSIFHDKYVLDDNGDLKLNTNPNILRYWFLNNDNILSYTLFKEKSLYHDEFLDYFYTKDPDIQRLKKYFKDAFPGASEIDTSLFLWPYHECDLTITITYELPSLRTICEFIN